MKDNLNLIFCIITQFLKKTCGPFSEILQGQLNLPGVERTISGKLNFQFGHFLICLSQIFHFPANMRNKDF